MAAYLSDLGIACSLGANKMTVLNNLVNAPLFKPLLLRKTLISNRMATEVILPFDLPVLEESFSNLTSRNNRLLKMVLDQIKPSINACIDKYGKHRVGIVMGTSSSGMEEGEQAYLYHKNNGVWPEKYHYMQQETASLSLFATQYLGTLGVSYTISTACSSGAKALCSAQRLIDANICDAVIAGGVDTLCNLIRNGFDCLELLGPDLCNPFSRNRKNITLGEGGAVFLLTKEKQSSSITLCGYGESSDAHQMSAPDETGEGADIAIKAALKKASLSPENISYINLHGTGTILNDLMESRSIKRLFGENVFCGSTKRLSGHVLGASGALEAGFIWLLLAAMDKDFITLPAHVYDGEYDPELSKISLVKEPMEHYVVNECNMMSNSFAFGGSNVSLILGKRE